MTINADDVNVLIAAHLRETNAPHTAYIFSHEAEVDDTIHLPPQSLITILQKGMLYMQLEKSINARVKNDDNNPESIINSIVDSAHQQENTHPQKPPQKPKNIPRPPPPPPPPVVKPPEPPLEKPLLTTLEPSKAQILKKHSQEVFCGAWTPDSTAFATASADATTIIWHLNKDRIIYETLTLDHGTQQDRSSKGVVSLTWNSTGTLLATGSNDGTARLWTNKGELKFVLNHHSGPVFAIQFSPNDQYLLTCSQDSQVIVWNVATGQQQQIFQYHNRESSALDVDWYDNVTFASCSADTNIIICSVGNSQLIKRLQGHTKDVNKISWDPSKKYLASCSDDTTVRVWRPFETDGCVTFNGHKAQVYTIKWVPGINSPRYLASGAFDSTIKVWDVPNSQCLYTITTHTQPIFTISFSPLGKFFASGGNDMVLNIFRTADGEQIGVYHTTGGLFDSTWSPDGKSIGLCETDHTIAILDTSWFPSYNE